MSDFAVDWEYWLGEKGELIYHSPSVKRLTGYPQELFNTGDDIVEILVHPDDKEIVRQHMHDETAGITENLEFRIVTQEGLERWFSHYCRNVHDSKGSPLGIRASNRDITEQKRLTTQLENTVQEKELLLKELNHRIKNNLAMVSSLIGLKSLSLHDTVDLTDIEHQIDAIRIVHEKLSQQESFTDISIKDYIQDLLASVFSLAATSIQTGCECIDDSIPTKKAVTIGLIINEIATNTVKYGIPAEEEAQFTLSFTKEESNNLNILSISNNGNAFPSDIKLDNPETLGLRLISILAEQLNGTIELEREPHPKFTIRFPAETG